MTRVPSDLDARFRREAIAEGLYDVSFGIAESPIGDLLLAATQVGICTISFDPDPERCLSELSQLFGPRVLEASEPLEDTVAQLDEYFRGERQNFELRLDLSAVTSFRRQILQELAEVPYGTVTTYATLARDAGRPGAARAVGGAMNRNPISIVLPCHRVVGADGDLTGYVGGLARKETLLTLEGASL